MEKTLLHEERTGTLVSFYHPPSSSLPSSYILSVLCDELV